MGKRKKNSKNKKNKIKRIIKIIIQLSVLLCLIVIMGGMGYFYKTYGRTIFTLQSQAKKVVSASTVSTFQGVQTSIVYDIDGEVIFTLRAEKDVYYLDYRDIPEHIVNAMIVTEDKKFFEHSGVDYLANVRAAIVLIKNKGNITQGASTITQQLARNVFLSHRVSYERKIEEIFIAQELENRYSKEQIMEFYLNNIYFANGHYGIQAASNGYFGKSVTQLSLSQIAFLCTIPNNPTLYNPLTNMENTLKRRDRILNQMLADEKITPFEHRVAINETIELVTPLKERANYVETYVLHSAIRALMTQSGFEFQYQFDNPEERKAYETEYFELYYGFQKSLYVSGYRIYTSIDMNKQKLLQEALDQELEHFEELSEEGIFQLQGAAVSIDNDTGRVIAIVGGRSQELKGLTLNRGYQSFRQPGSAIKPLLVYTPAFERDYTPDSIVVDERFEGGPRNSGNTYSGKMSMQRAIEVSKNTIAWRLFEEITPSVGLSYLLSMNFSKISEDDYYPAASLGGFTHGVSPLEMAAAYSALENDGVYREPTAIIKIMDAKGNEVVGELDQSQKIYEPNAARMITEALTGVLKRGTAKGLGLTHTVSAGKTGTTDDRKDGWFVGYTPYYTTSVWVGYDMPRKVEGLSGGTYPARIWHSYMEQIHTSSMKRNFQTYDWRTHLIEKIEPPIDEEDKEIDEVLPIEPIDPVEDIQERDNTDRDSDQDIIDDIGDEGFDEDQDYPDEDQLDDFIDHGDLEEDRLIDEDFYYEDPESDFEMD